MRDIWLISDTHHGHHNIIKYCNRPFSGPTEMDDFMVETWNSVVKPQDKVYHLGDVYMGCSNGYAESVLKRLNGHKRLVLGNHDNGKDQLLQRYFEKIEVWRMFPEFGLLLTHVPLHPSSLRRGPTQPLQTAQEGWIPRLGGYMREVRFIGDVHGRYKQYHKIIRDCDRSIQVGDMGIGFYGYKGGELKKLPNPHFDTMSLGDHKFIRGNHDNPQHCLNHPYCKDDGTFEDGIYYLGGAVSIDRAYRTEGLDWWPDEELSQERLDIELEVYKDLKPDVVVTHDCPESIARQMMDILNIWDKDKFPSRTRKTLDQMFFHHQPKLWVFGHWHKTIDFDQLGTHFLCLGELEYRDIDLDEYGGSHDD